jgi:hypothetical protein
MALIRRLACRLGLTVASLVAITVGIELVGRSLGLWKTALEFRYSETRGYAFVPGVGSINSLGFRGPEVDLDKEAGVVRIVVLGDSFTYGHGVGWEEAFPARCEQILHARGSSCVQVLNLGVPGYNTVMELAFLRELGLRLDADGIVVGFTLSDAELGRFGLRDPSNRVVLRSKQWLRQNFGLYHFVRRQLFSMQAWRMRHDPEVGVWPAILPLRRATRGESDAGWKTCNEALIAIAEECRAAHIPCVLVIWPVLEDLSDYAYDREHEFVRGAATAAGFRVLDLRPYFSGPAARFWVSSSDRHPNPVAHEKAATALADFLRDVEGLAEPCVVPAK